MIIRHSLIVCLAVFLMGSLANAADKVDFQRDIFPILETHCVGCHTADDAEGGFVMENHAGIMLGGDSGMAVTAGVPASSRMLLMASGKLEPKMPPDDDGPSEEELAIIATWIEQGAEGPENPGDVPIKRKLRTPTIQPADDLTKPITAIAVSDDGRMQAVARFNQVDLVRVDATEQDASKPIAIQGDFGKVNSVRFNRDGSQLLIASGLTGAYGVASVFDTSDGSPIIEMIGHRDVLYAAEFSPDESMIATAGYDRVITLWDAQKGNRIRDLKGHNGAIFDLEFSPDGKVIVSACADETVKVWHVQSGQRLDTLGQPEGEVYCVGVSPDGKFVVAGSRDNRLRVWRLKSIDKPTINPLLVTRFVDESPITQFAWSSDGQEMVVMSQAGNLKTLTTKNWMLGNVLDPIDGVGSDMQIVHDASADVDQILISTMAGKLTTRRLRATSADERPATNDAVKIDPIYIDVGPAIKVTETDSSDGMTAMQVPRGAEIEGAISATGQTDTYHWKANRGEVWSINADARAVDGKSRLDPIIAILDSSGQPVLRTRLQATRDSYFTFRGKDSKQINDFRLFAWEEMHLNDYLYAGGEVTRLSIYPRGPDSGFNVYPNDGERWTYFGTTHTTHALGEPCYVVRPLAMGEEPVANGLPVFDLYYENDDDPSRVAGNSSRLIFHVPADDTYSVAIADTRLEGGEGYAYNLKIRPAVPTFEASVSQISKPLHPGSGREFQVRVERYDGYEGPITFDLDDGQLPDGVRCDLPITVEAGQKIAAGMIWVPESMTKEAAEFEPQLVARANILGRMVERDAGSIGKLKVGDAGKFVVSIQPNDHDVAFDETWKLSVRRGETVTAKVVLHRAVKMGERKAFTAEVPFGKENAGRNAAFGVYVDNIGLNGLLVRAKEDVREFFLTADEEATLGPRPFFLTGSVDGGITSQPIIVEVLP